MARCTMSQPMPRLRSGAVAGDAVAHAVDAPELLGVDVQQLAGCRALVAHDRQPAARSACSRDSPSRFMQRLTVADAAPGLRGDAPQRPALAAQSPRAAPAPARVSARGLRARPRAAVGQARQPLGLEARQPLVAVRRLTPAASARRATVQPCSSTRLTSRARPLAVNLACLWLFIRPSELGWCLDNPSFPNHGRMNNLLEHHS